MNDRLVNTDRTSFTILCVIDFSESSRHALQWAVSMAERFPAHLVILYTFRLLQSKSTEALQTKRGMEEQAMNNFALLEKELLQSKAFTYEFRTEVGFVNDRVEDHLKKNVIQLLVAGKKVSVDNRETFDILMEDIQIPLVIVP